MNCFGEISAGNFGGIFGAICGEVFGEIYNGMKRRTSGRIQNIEEFLGKLFGTISTILERTTKKDTSEEFLRESFE